MKTRIQREQEINDIIAGCKKCKGSAKPCAPHKSMADWALRPL